MIRIAVTGGFCSGKSRVVRFLSERGCPVFDCDRIVKDELYRDAQVAARVCEILGEDVIDARAGTVDGRRIWRIFFEDGDRKKALEDYVHPLVFSRLEKGFADAQAQGAAVAVAEVPVLYGDIGIFDVVVLVASRRELVFGRAEGRGYPSGLCRDVLSLQPDWRRRAELADYVIWNDASLAELERRTDEIFDALMLKKTASS